MFNRLKKEPIVVLLVMLLLLVGTIAAYSVNWDMTFTHHSNVYIEGGILQETNTNTSESAITLTKYASGQTFYSTTAVSYTLPADPTGLTFTLVVGATELMAFNPAAGDTILGGTVDYYYQADAIGETLTVRGISSSLWGIQSYFGTWNWVNDS